MTSEGLALKTTNGVAAAGLTMPFWVPSLDQVSGVAGAMVPVLSALWLLVQIARFVWSWKKEADHGENA